MNTPVYIITGFLESGKTRFITEMLTDDGFSEGERTLLICCEEGEEPYDPELLRRTNTVLVMLEDMEDLSGDRLSRLNQEYRPERVLVEFNSTWLLESLYACQKPDNWDLAQIITLVDASTFDIYLKNMRKFMADGLQEADLVIFNRCTEETAKSAYRRTVLAMNNTARIFFENTDGSMDDGVSDEDLPYDMSAPVIEIGDAQFGIFYLDALEHADRYDGKTVRIKGRAFRMKQMPKNCFVFGRHAMTCCADDIGGIGYLCRWQDALPAKNAWIMLTARVESGFSPLHNRDGINLLGITIEPAQPPEEELVYFN